MLNASAAVVTVLWLHASHDGLVEHCLASVGSCWLLCRVPDVTYIPTTTGCDRPSSDDLPYLLVSRCWSIYQSAQCRQN